MILDLRQTSPGRVQAEYHPMHEASPHRPVRIVGGQGQPHRRLGHPFRGSGGGTSPLLWLYAPGNR
jgi:hypothetical protein